jgi:hypothetical protein
MNDDFYCKRTYYFVNDDRSMLSSALLDAEYTIIVKDAQGAETQISFRVTRNAHLSSISHWIYGQVLNPVTDSYEQVEFKLHKEHPEYDTIEVFPRAAPVMFTR